MPRQAIFEYPGFDTFKTATYTLTHGIQPGIVTATTYPQGTELAQVGTVKFTFDDVEIELPDCRVMSPRLSRYPDIWTVQIADRRWKWAFPHVIGRYNVRVPSEDAQVAEEIQQSTEKTPQELATLLLNEMGESGHDVTRLPNEARPSVTWDYTNAAAELQTLVESLGCRVVLGWDNKVRIKVLGEGEDLPLERVIGESASFSRGSKPDSLLLVGAPVIHGLTFALEAVGIDTDKKIKPINDLSYKPSAGWEVTALGQYTPPAFTNLADIETDDGKKILELARQSVYKWYRIKSIAGRDDFAIPGAPADATELDQVLPLINETPEPADVPEFARTVKPEDGYIQGNYYDKVHEGDRTGEEHCKRSFSLDTAKGIVKFSEPIHRFSDEKWRPADLYLTCSCAYSDPETGMKVRYTKERTVPGNNNDTSAQIIQHDDVKKIISHKFDFETDNDQDGRMFTLADDTDNEAEIEPIADHYLQSTLRTFERVDGGSVTLEGIQKIEPDGAIQQVSIGTHNGPDGSAATTVSRNDEHDRATVPYAIKRRTEKAKELESMSAGMRAFMANFSQ